MTLPSISIGLIAFLVVSVSLQTVAGQDPSLSPSIAPTAEDCFGICGLDGILLNPDQPILESTCGSLDSAIRVFPPGRSCEDAAASAKVGGCKCENSPTSEPTASPPEPTETPTVSELMPAETAQPAAEPTTATTPAPVSSSSEIFHNWRFYLASSLLTLLVFLR